MSHARGEERRQRREEAGLVKVNPKLKRDPTVAALLSELKRLRTQEHAPRSGDRKFDL